MLLRTLPLGALLVVLSACTVTPDPCADGRCDTSTPTGPVYGKRADGRVDVTAAQAWPTRATELAPLTTSELARACVAAGSCLASKDAPSTLIGICVTPDPSEERAIPEGSKNERRSWVLRAALAGASCAAINALETARQAEIYCEEDGCWWRGTSVPPSVTCAADVATMKVADGRTFTRDCSRAYQKCDPTSPTGCTDRHPVACDKTASDRCDGAIKLGCDSAGRVSFHDCGRVAGGTCVEKADGSAGCVYPDAKKCSTSGSACSADGKTVTLCVAGEQQEVDCTELGFAGCTAGACK